MQVSLMTARLSTGAFLGHFPRLVSRALDWKWRRQLLAPEVLSVTFREGALSQFGGMSRLCAVLGTHVCVKTDALDLCPWAFPAPSDTRGLPQVSCAPTGLWYCP